MRHMFIQTSFLIFTVIVTSPDTDHSSWITLYTYCLKRRCVEIMKNLNILVLTCETMFIKCWVHWAGNRLALLTLRHDNRSPPQLLAQLIPELSGYYLSSEELNPVGNNPQEIIETSTFVGRRGRGGGLLTHGTVWATGSAGVSCTLRIKCAMSTIHKKLKNFHRPSF
jgi:hypothetical protein